nr:TniQ family protein [Methylobacterium sp. NEAU K]
MYFPLRPRHRLHEPAHGYVLRLVEANGYAWRGCKLSQVGASLSGLANGMGFDFACRHGQADLAQLAFSTPRLCGPGRYRLCGQVLHRPHLVFGRKRFCPSCWAEDRIQAREDGPHIRCWWSVAAVSACPFHLTRLTDRCHACGRPGDFESGGLTTCRCGADLIISPSAGGAFGSASVDSYIVGRLAALPSSQMPILDDLTLGDAIVFLQRLGCIAQPGSLVRLTDVSRLDRVPLMVAGMEMCILGERAVEAALGQYLDATGRTDAFKSALGSFYIWLRNLGPSPARAWVMDRLAAVFQGRHFLWMERRGDGSHSPTIGRVNLRAAGKLLDLSHTPTRRVLETTGLLPQKGPRHIRHTVDRGQVVEVRRLLDRLIDVPTASSRLGINAKSVLALASGGILPRSDLGRQAFGNATVFDPDDVDALPRRLTRSAISVDRMPAGGRSLPSVSRTCGMVELCRRILDGLTEPCAVIVGETGLKAIVLGADIHRSFDDAYRDSHLTVSAARRRLGLREATMAGLIAGGHIPSESVKGNRKLVRSDIVEAFAARYVSASEVARIWRTSTTVVLERMRAANCLPAIEFERAGRIGPRFFERATIARVGQD